jgi:hypothetical protein
MEYPKVGAVKVKCVHVRSEGWSPHIFLRKEDIMKLTNIKELDAFKEAIAKCRGDVWLTSPYGDKY